MKYTVTFSQATHQDIAEHFWIIHHDSPTHAEQWLRDLYAAIEQLGTMPRRHALARENDKHPEELRQFRHHSHRVIYTILDDKREVRILHVRHTARKNVDCNE